MKVYCESCKYFSPMLFNFMVGQMSIPEYCEANPGDTYLRPGGDLAEPSIKNKDNNCPDYEEKK